MSKLFDQFVPNIIELADSSAKVKHPQKDTCVAYLEMNGCYKRNSLNRFLAWLVESVEDQTCAVFISLCNMIPGTRYVHVCTYM